MGARLPLSVGSFSGGETGDLFSKGGRTIPFIVNGGGSGRVGARATGQNSVDLGSMFFASFGRPTAKKKKTGRKVEGGGKKGAEESRKETVGAGGLWDEVCDLIYNQGRMGRMVDRGSNGRARPRLRPQSTNS